MSVYLFDGEIGITALGRDTEASAEANGVDAEATAQLGIQEYAANLGHVALPMNGTEY